MLLSTKISYFITLVMIKNKKSFSYIITCLGGELCGLYNNTRPSCSLSFFSSHRSNIHSLMKVHLLHFDSFFVKWDPGFVS